MQVIQMPEVEILLVFITVILVENPSFLYDEIVIFCHQIIEFY